MDLLTAVFEDKDLGVQEENHIFPNDTTTMSDDATEDVRVEGEKNKTQTGHRIKFPVDILKFGYNKWSCDLSFRCQQLRCIFPGNGVPQNWREVLHFLKNTGIPLIFPFFVPSSRVPLFPIEEFRFP